MRAAKLIVAVLCLLLVEVLPATSVAHDERQWQSQYCEGMKLEKHLPSGGQVDCLSPEYAIEVMGKEMGRSRGQSLYYADATARKPGIILLCEKSEGPVEGECRSYVYRLEEALKFVNTHVYVWVCAIDKDVKLDDCFRPQIQPTTKSSPQSPLTPEPPSRPADLPQKPTQVAPNENSAIATEQKLSLPPLHEDSEALPQQSGIFSCGQRKYCKDMSCAEACFHFVQCGEVDLDRDSDNIPCENVCHKPCTATKIGHVLGGRSK